jgi:hypothetical protein
MIEKLKALKLESGSVYAIETDLDISQPSFEVAADALISFARRENIRLLILQKGFRVVRYEKQECVICHASMDHRDVCDKCVANFMRAK